MKLFIRGGECKPQNFTAYDFPDKLCNFDFGRITWNLGELFCVIILEFEINFDSIDFIRDKFYLMGLEEIVE